MTKTEHNMLELVDPQGCDKIPTTVIGAVQMLKVNVLVNTLCNKYWGPDLEAVKLRLEANNNFARGNCQEAAFHEFCLQSVVGVSKIPQHGFGVNMRGCCEDILRKLWRNRGGIVGKL